MQLTVSHREKCAEWAREIETRGGQPLRNAWADIDRLDGMPGPFIPLMPSHPLLDSSAFQEIAQAPLGRLGVSILLDLGIDGFLHRAEAFKLYELARLSPGDVLELGTHKGLSTSLLCRALSDRNSGLLETVDIDAAANEIAQANVRPRPGGERVTFTLRDATERLDELKAEGRRYGFVFVDHWHGYDATRDAASRMGALVVPGGYVMFHDFFDPANVDPDHVYGVYQGVLDGLDYGADWHFVGSAGGSAVFSRRQS